MRHMWLEANKAVLFTSVAGNEPSKVVTVLKSVTGITLYKGTTTAAEAALIREARERSFIMFRFED